MSGICECMGPKAMHSLFRCLLLRSDLGAHGERTLKREDIVSRICECMDPKVIHTFQTSAFLGRRDLGGERTIGKRGRSY